MGAVVDDASLVEEHHLVGEADGRLAVGDDDERGAGPVGGGRRRGLRRVARPRGAQGGEDARLHLGVDGGGRVVEHEQPRTPHQRPGERQALPLTAGQRRAALPQLGVEAGGQAPHEVRGLGGLERRPHLGVLDVEAERDVAPHRVVEEERRLRDDRDRVRERAVLQVAQVGAVHPQRPGLGIDQTGEQRGERALAGGRGPDDGDGAARLDREADVAQHGRVLGVPEADPLELQPRARAGAGEPVVAVGEAALGVEHVADPLVADHAARQVAEEPADGADGERDDGQQVGHRDDRAGLAGAVEHAGDAHDQHQQHPEVGQRVEDRVEGGAEPAGPDRDVAQLLAAPPEALGLLALPAEGLDHHRAVERLVGDLADDTAELLHTRHQRGGDALEPQVDDDDGREDQQADEREHEVGDHHLHDRDDHHRDGADRHGERRDRPPGGLHVGVGVGEQDPGRVTVVPRHRERQVLPRHGAAVVRLHPVLHDAGAEAPRHDADRAEDGDADEERDDRDEHAGADLAVAEGREHHVVGGPPEHPGVGHRERPEQDAAERREGEDPRLPPDRDPEDAQARPRRRPSSGAT